MAMRSPTWSMSAGAQAWEMRMIQYQQGRSNSRRAVAVRWIPELQDNLDKVSPNGWTLSMSEK